MRREKLLAYLYLLLMALGCTGELVFSDLANPRARLVLKGTYETNDPYGWLPFFNDDAYDSLVAPGQPLHNTDFHTQTLSHGPQHLEWYIDLAEVRLGQGSGPGGGRDAEDYWEFFSRQRLLLCSRYDALQDKELKSCRQEEGLAKLEAFFGEGVEIKANDVLVGTYNHLALYYRKIITNPALLFSDTGSFLSQSTAIFENRGVRGTDIAERYQYSALGGNATLLFPLERKDLKLNIPDENRPYVLEVRTFLKNNINRHIIRVGGLGTTVYFLGPADFRINHRYNTLLESGRLGGNILMDGRIYQPGKVGAVDVSLITIAGGGAVNYKAAIPLGDSFDPQKQLAYAATRGDGMEIRNLPPGSYEILALCDKKRRATGDVLEAGFDGFPETASPPCAQVTITEGSTVISPPATCSCP
ncbi:MAG: hypothetical protein NZM25_04890 [Leptospiraceae bacterium]|nr:hypothetical protein [Leptospiraceae bacterium]MDW8305654.1 hypothetical protein [Leptospiraceae bacterium]